MSKCKYTKKYRDQRKIWFLELKSHYRCMVCGEKRPVCLDFHHRQSRDKTNGNTWKLVSRMAGGGNSKKLILDEIKKCDCLCSNCHRVQQEEARISNTQNNDCETSPVNDK